MRAHHPKRLSDLPDVEFDVAVTLGWEGDAPDLRARRREDWRTPCPKHMPPDEFRAVRDRIGERVKELLARLRVQEAVGV